MIKQLLSASLQGSNNSEYFFWKDTSITCLVVLIILVGISIAGISIVILTMAYYRRKDKRKIIALEQRLLLTQMNPHFVFNSLTAIQSYIFRNEPYLAGKYLANFSKLVRLILHNSRLEYITIAKENETLKHYLDLQNLRFGGRFDYSIEIDPKIEQDQYCIPPMLTQPFIENSIEHGLIHLTTKGMISIRFLLAEPDIVLEVEDNGVGIENSAKLNKKKREEHQSLATRITLERLKNFRKVFNQEIKMEIIDLSNFSKNSTRGTLVRFTMPTMSKNDFL